MLGGRLELVPERRLPHPDLLGIGLPASNGASIDVKSSPDCFEQLGSKLYMSTF